MARALVDDTDEFASIAYRPAAGASILAQTYAEEELTAVAAAAAVHGIASLPDGIPVETVGEWASVDRIEIQSLRSVRNILEEYIAAEAARWPRLSTSACSRVRPSGGGQDVRRAPAGHCPAAGPAAHPGVQPLAVALGG